MVNKNTADSNAQLVGVRIKSIKRAGIEDVYCLAAAKNGNMIANGIIARNCDALRYFCASHKIVQPYNTAAEQYKHQEWYKSRYDVRR